MKMPRSFALASISLFASTMSIFAQGSLTPPGTPAPTMKTLDQVEARTIVNSTNTPGNATNLFIISARGSYYLTGNITGATSKHGIQINADDVTLDLNGFSVIGTASATSGIIVLNVHRNIRICNGHIQNWGNSGIDGVNASNSEFDHLRLRQNGTGLICGVRDALFDISADSSSSGAGIRAGSDCRLFACTATSSVTGFDIGSGSVINACVATGNTGNGISTNIQGTIIGCTASTNSSAGISTSSDCVVKDCAASGNGAQGINCGGIETRCTIISCTANANGTAGASDGINAGNHSLVKNCVAAGNTGNGIRVTGDSLVIENQSNNNTVDGIKATGSVNRIDSNHTCLNTGIGINAGNDWVVRNSSGANTGGNIVGAGADIAPSQTAATATNPFANMP